MKNAIVYKAHLPTASQLGANLSERPWRELLSSERIRHAFIEGSDGLRVHPFEQGYAICLRTDEKIIPSSVVSAEVEKRAKEYEDRYATPMDKEQKAGAKEQVIDEFLQVALIKQRHTWAYYDAENQFLFVDTASKPVADALMTELVHACESVKTETINISGIRRGLTAKLRDLIERDLDDNRSSPFGVFGIGSNLALSRKMPQEPLERIVYTEADITSHEVLAQLYASFDVEQIELGRGQTYFRLNKDFHLKRIEWPDYDPIETDDPVEQWQHDVGTKVIYLTDIVLKLCEIMEYEPPKLDEEEDSGPTTDKPAD